MMILRAIFFTQVLLMVTQEVIGGARLVRQKRPLDLFDVDKTEEFNKLEKDTFQLDQELASRGLIAPNAAAVKAEAENLEEAILESKQVDEKLINLGTMDIGNFTLEFDGKNVTIINNTDGFYCIDKVMTVSEIVYDEEIRCNHVSYKNCYQAYKTVYRPQSSEICKENFKRICFIEYEDVAKTEVVRICSSKAERNCKIDGPNVCSTVYETICETKFRNYNVTDQSANCSIISEEICFTNDNGKPDCRQVPRTVCEIDNNDLNKSFPETECRKEPNEVCGPEKCPVVTTDSCEDIEKTFVTPVPKERCELKPYKICNTEIISLPSLEQVNECIDVPKEVCSVEQVNPRQVARPVIKKWCARDLTALETSTDLPDGEDFTTTPASNNRSG